MLWRKRVLWEKMCSVGAIGESRNVLFCDFRGRLVSRARRAVYPLKAIV